MNLPTTMLCTGLAFLTTISIGCSDSPPEGTVEGIVTLNGKPYDDAAVMFLDATTGQAAGTDIQDGGQFALKEPVPTGTYSVYLAPRTVPMEEGSPEAVKIDESVPEKYWNEASTDIQAIVNEGENSVTIELKKS
ncbi:carboxypeptidase regulatory-like domain-containing protein [Rhodopirellula sp. P2]|uniref:carboxypeptidase regulatory-like domain-containing protein n=1 Tax=Rhodopirellula sp. P2 TaxID=2127060 RepID=UPI00236804BC|nr:carboxypeptidase regulatory-like domain-containing protein [Rhodopirellula sp. P2]WDQ15061.1 carboxypeptidase regulatory-like domain-containing protein [Rhodopirellula sp. P2]